MFFKKLMPLLVVFITLLTVISCSPRKPLIEETGLNTASTDSSKLTNKEKQPSPSSSETMLTTQNLNIIPMEVNETLKFYHPAFPAKGVTGLPDTYLSVADPGWKFVNIRLAFENPSANFVTVKPWSNLPDIKLKTEQGWFYELDTSFLGGVDSVFLPFWQCYTNNTNTNISGRFQIPGNFRISGDKLFGLYAFDYDDRESYYLIFRASEKSSGYTLLIPGYPDIKLKSNLTEIVFPTTLPNSSFRTIGDTVNIPNKGNIKISGFTRNNDSDSASLQVELSNTSEGYDQEFNLGFIFVGDDGIFRCQGSDKIFGIIPDLDLPESIVVGPGQTNNLKINVHIPNDVKNIKLTVTGDISDVINLD